MLKKMIALAAALAFVSVLPALASPTVSKRPVPFKIGTITTWDAAAKHGVVKDAKGNETAFDWDDQTTLAGTGKVGEHAYVWYKTDKDGKLMATHINIGARPMPKKATPATTTAK